MLPDVVCGNSTVPVLGISLALALVAWRGSALSFLRWRQAGFDTVKDSTGGRGGTWWQDWAPVSGALFGLVIVMQDVAALVLSGWERW